MRTHPDFDAIASQVTPDQLAELIGAKPSNSSADHHCPGNGHDNGDRVASLSINRVDGRTVGCCHKCDLQGSPVQIAATVWGVSDTESADRIAEKLGLSAPSNPGRSRIVEEYDYTGPDGDLLFQVVRLLPKDFRQRHVCPEAHDRFTWGLGGSAEKCRCGRVDPVLYRLPWIIEAVALGKLVHVVEGEKDVHAIESGGGVATCNPMGATKWRESYSQVLRGARVLIVADRDDDGRAHARAVAKSLDGIAASVQIVQAKMGKDATDHLHAGHGLDEFEPLEDDPDADRAPILIREELNSVTDEAIAALAAMPELGVYVRGRNLVTVVTDDSNRRKWLRRPQGSPSIVPIEFTRMLGLLDDAAMWVKPSSRSASPTPKRPPDWVAKQVLHRLEWPFPYLEAVIEAPTLRPDGSVLATPGWDEDTGLLYMPTPGDEWPAVPWEPTAGDVEEAVETLCDPVRDFPFVAESDKAAYVSAVLSIVCRHLIDGPVPGFPIRAPTPGTGKTLLADVIGIVGTGRVPSAMSMTYQNEEFRKRILALALDGTSLVLLENVSGSLGSDVLAAALTATEWRDRYLGRSEMVSAPLTAVWLMTGNNLGFKRTLGRRVVPIDLDAKVETPEDRGGFAHADLRAHVHEFRPEMVIAALTLFRAFYLAGRPPHGGVRMGSYEAWDDQVRSAVIWAGLDDPATTDEGRGRGRVRSQADDDLEGLGALLEVLGRLYPSRLPFKAAAVIQQAEQDIDLRTVIDTVAAPPHGGHASAKSLGGTFRENRDRPIQGRVLRRVKRTWVVEVMEEE